MNRPAEGQCPVCGTVFKHPARPQGGGARRIYCSHKCRANDWARGNAKKRKASVTKYEAKPENKSRKRVRQRLTRVARYGMSHDAFVAQLERQRFTCYGCIELIDADTAAIDHDHKTGKVRGLLCKHCNWTLGHAKDNPATLRRLTAFLDYQRDKLCVYLGGALKNSRVPELGNVLRDRGYDVMDEWHTPGEHADTNWQAYERQRGRTYEQALRGRAAQNIFLFDRAYIDLCDVFVLVMPAGKSAMLELGYAKGLGKTTVLFMDGQQPDRYDVMPNAADFLIGTEAELIELLSRRESYDDNRVKASNEKGKRK